MCMKDAAFKEYLRRTDLIKSSQKFSIALGFLSINFSDHFETITVEDKG